ncbi:NAD(P)/FAD-dependent oxidoreductase [Bisbaumannia pacifica]|uniref:Amino acid dehydrogenase n=1 Tax=Bisbaumannia pacifica TaxID=77098 RepID=A0A510XGL1_9GAMM|nr:FAD-dependent oxidoreductase [Halomonas pacifica]MBH8580149.1 FAD-binding oxidoreductase [Halomonas pacifica]GEK48290.1 amino acid dehydrogenase [Halomonas pacifica]
MASQDPAAGNFKPDCNIVVIGAGIIGIACALSLSRLGWRVLVLDKQEPGMGASYGNAGHMATEQVFPIADASILMRLPKMLMDPMGPLRLDWRHFPKALPWFAQLLWNLRPAPYQASVAGIRSLNEASLYAWHRLLDSVNGGHLLKKEGSFLIYEDERSREAIDVLESRLDAQQVAAEYWQGDAVRTIAPQLSKRIKGGLFFPETAHVVDPWQVVDTLTKAAKANGVRFQRDEVLTGKVDDRGVNLKMANSPAIRADKVLVACGAHSAPLTTALTGTRVPLDTERGYHLMLPREKERLPVAITSLERRFIMTPMDEGLRLAGTVEFAGLHRPPNMQRAWQLHRLSQGLFETDLDTADARPWMGFRPSLPDSLPIIDSAKDGKVLLAFGHHHLGLTQAAVTAELIANLAIQGDSPTSSTPHYQPDHKPYRLTRFSSYPSE